jgi:hypothetical protein
MPGSYRIEVILVGLTAPSCLLLLVANNAQEKNRSTYMYLVMNFLLRACSAHPFFKMILCLAAHAIVWMRLRRQLRESKVEWASRLFSCEVAATRAFA